MALDYRSEYRRYKRYYSAAGPLLKDPAVRAYFSLIASVVTVTIFLVFAIRPTIATIVGLQKQITDKKAFAQKLDTKINALALLQTEYQEIEPDLGLVDEAMPASPDLGAAIILLENTASSSGVRLESVSVSKVNYYSSANQSAVTAIPIDLQLSGTYDVVSYFLKQLVNLPRIFVISKITIGQHTQSGTINKRPANELPVKLTVKGLYYP